MSDGLKDPESPELREFREVSCPNCHLIFPPLASLVALEEITCPRCRHRFPPSEGKVTAVQHARGNPPGPFTKPADSPITVTTAGSEMQIRIPGSRRSGGLLLNAMLWNLVAWPVAIWVTWGSWTETGAYASRLIVWLLPVIGLTLLYFALRHRFATHLLTLTRQTVRLRHSFLFPTTLELPTAAIQRVEKVRTYTQDYRPVYAVEIKAGPRRLRFGAFLSGDEKNWLAWEVRNFARENGAPLDREE